MKKRKISEKYSEKELADSFVFRNTLSKSEREEIKHDIAGARAKLKSKSNILEIKRSEFANEISIDDTYLSQIINRHRPPSEEVIIRLELHSRNLINAITWFKLFEKENENEIDSDKPKREKEKKFVKKTMKLE